MVQAGMVSTWLLICAVADYRTGEVSNWLTLPVYAAVLILRILGVLTTPWWTLGASPWWKLGASPWWSIIAISLTVLIAWQQDLLGGADAKGWLIFALLGDFYPIAAALGMVVWLLAVQLAARQMGGRLVRVAGFPGYLLGVLWLVTVQVL